MQSIEYQILMNPANNSMYMLCSLQQIELESHAENYAL